jgi:hypothetical protein
MEPVSSVHTFIFSFSALLLSLILVIGSAWWVFRRKPQSGIRSAEPNRGKLVPPGNRLPS